MDPKGIEPSNLTDANRALSQLSYGPVFAAFYAAMMSISNFRSDVKYFFISAVPFFTERQNLIGKLRKILVRAVFIALHDRRELFDRCGEPAERR